MTDATKLVDERWCEANGLGYNDPTMQRAAVTTTEPVAWQKLADEMIMSLGSIKLGVVDQYELRAAMLKLMKIAAAPPVAAPEDALREALEDMIDLATNISPYALSTNTKTRLARARAALPAKDGAGSQVTRPNGGSAA